MKFILALIMLFPNSVVHAIDRVGNGGGLWACTSPQQTVLHGQLVDLYEAEQEFGLNLIRTQSKDPNQIFNERKEFFHYFVGDLAQTTLPFESAVFKKLRFVNSVLTIIDDSLFRLSPLPSTCQGGTWQYLQFANFTDLDQVLIRKDIWNHPEISAVDKAALLWHEVIYLWLRVTKGDTNSVRTRIIIGYLFSDLPGPVVSEKIHGILKNDPVTPPPDHKPPTPVPQPKEKWACLSKNSHESLYFIGYGMIRKEAESSALQSCKNGSDGFYCDTSYKCEEIKSHIETWFCESNNTHESKVFSGRGRNKIEATYRALNECQTKSDGFFCSESHVSCSN